MLWRYGWSGDNAPHIPNFYTRWRWVTIFMLSLLQPQERSPIDLFRYFLCSSHLSYPSISVPESYLVWMHGYEEHRHWKCSNLVMEVHGMQLCVMCKWSEHCNLTVDTPAQGCTCSNHLFRHSKVIFSSFLYSLYNVFCLINCMGIWGVVWTHLGKLMCCSRAYSQAALSIKIHYSSV